MYKKLFCLSGVLLLSNLTFPLANASGYTETKNPVILVHGLFGYDRRSGSDYWYGVSDHLTRSGAKVYTPNNSAVNGSDVRGEQLIDYLDELKAIHGYKKFNLLAHSQGGFDARYVASTRPDLVASMTAVGSPAKGAGLAQFLLDNTENHPRIRKLLYKGANLFGHFIEASSGDNDPQDSEAAAHVLSYVGAAQFNRTHPQAIPRSKCGQGSSVVNGIYYYSLSGDSPFNNPIDPSDYTLAIASLFESEDNDGVVGRCSSHIGKVLRDDYSWNHSDEVNQLFGVRGWRAQNPLSVYRSHVNRLKKLGL